MVVKVNELKAEIEELCSVINPTPTVQPHIQFKWTSVPKTDVGSSSLTHTGTFSFTIPSVIPSTASEVLIYVAAHSGGADRGSTSKDYDITLFTQIGTIRYEKYLHLFPYFHIAINTNSDNMWFPMPPNRRVYLALQTAHGANVLARLYAIGYR